VCGIRGHELLGTDAARLREEDALFAREGSEVRWYRCLRCDSWLPLRPPEQPAREYPPGREEVEPPPRGRALRDKIVLRLIALDRGLHFVLLAASAVIVEVIATHEATLRSHFYRVLSDLQGALGGQVHSSPSSLALDLGRLFSLPSGTLRLAGAVIGGYALLEGAEAVGLWLQRRWAEYLTFIATTALLPLEVYELTLRVSPFKVVALVINLAVVAYLLVAKRLFGLRGGAAAETAERERDSGWAGLERYTPALGSPSAPAPLA
jgi:uncharacterized membrane protein (DUF2068 family)